MLGVVCRIVYYHIDMVHLLSVGSTQGFILRFQKIVSEIIK